MAYRLNRGMGRTPAQDTQCKGELFGGFFDFSNCWSPLVPSTVAPVGSPTGDALTVPPSSGEQAQATVDTLVNQQLLDQQALNAQGVQSGLLDQAASGAVAVGSVVSNAFPWLLVGIAGFAVFALVAIGGGLPGRYGR